LRLKGGPNCAPKTTPNLIKTGHKNRPVIAPKSLSPKPVITFTPSVLLPLVFHIRTLVIMGP
jgi:hypothetical protein